MELSLEVIQLVADFHHAVADPGCFGIGDIFPVVLIHLGQLIRSEIGHHPTGGADQQTGNAVLDPGVGVVDVVDEAGGHIPPQHMGRHRSRPVPDPIGGEGIHMAVDQRLGDAVALQPKHIPFKIAGGHAVAAAHQAFRNGFPVGELSGKTGHNPGIEIISRHPSAAVHTGYRHIAQNVKHAAAVGQGEQRVFLSLHMSGKQFAVIGAPTLQRLVIVFCQQIRQVFPIPDPELTRSFSVLKEEVKLVLDLVPLLSGIPGRHFLIPGDSPTFPAAALFLGVNKANFIGKETGDVLKGILVQHGGVLVQSIADHQPGVGQAQGVHRIFRFHLYLSVMEFQPLTGEFRVFLHDDLPGQGVFYIKPEAQIQLFGPQNHLIDDVHVFVA